MSERPRISLHSIEPSATARRIDRPSPCRSLPGVIYWVKRTFDLIGSCRMSAEFAANPLLDFSGLPRLDEVRPEHVTPAIDLLVLAARNAIEVAATDTTAASWDNVAEPLADALDRLNRAWAAVQHLNAVVSTPSLRDAYHANLPKITAFFADLAQ